MVEIRILHTVASDLMRATYSDDFSVEWHTPGPLSEWHGTGDCVSQLPVCQSPHRGVRAMPMPPRRGSRAVALRSSQAVPVARTRLRQMDDGLRNDENGDWLINTHVNNIGSARTHGTRAGTS